MPFAVAPGTARLEVHYEVTPHGDGECVIDLGCLEGESIRGWSGGSKPGFFMTEAQATPGYLPAPLTPGPWAVLLGTYKLPTGGCTCTVTITQTPRERRWLRGDLHHHTHHSDGAHSVAEVMKLAEEAGLDFIALTDHNTISQNRVATESPVLAIPGLEVTTNHGHLNILGATELVDFRFRTAREFRRPAQGLVVLNHPHCDFCPWELEFDVDCDLVEVWNGVWTARNERALAWWQTQLVAGRRLPAVGGSDTHSVGLWSVIRTGAPTTYTLADDNTVPAILAALKAGRTMISDMPDGPALWLSAAGAVPGESVTPGYHEVRINPERAEDCRLRLIDRNGIRYEEPAQESTFRWEALPGNFLRAELRSVHTGMVRALTNPIYVGE
ncbi:MAG TPA: CehA/McbA family metallohydrolase [Symbiobacteriaceae bacterium]|nr:CehA/McbA family metallohydrolase [Symbiobacteriaceae bacterium]